MLNGSSIHFTVMLNLLLLMCPGGIRIAALSRNFESNTRFTVQGCSAAFSWIKWNSLCCCGRKAKIKKTNR